MWGKFAGIDDPVVHRDPILSQESAGLSGEIVLDIVRRFEVITKSGRRTQSVRCQ
jgi:hypothetical protein